MSWVDFLLGFSLIAQMAILFAITLTRQKFLPYLGEKSLNLVSFGFVSLVCGQLLQLLIHFDVFLLWRNLAFMTQSLGYIAFFFAILLAFKEIIKSANEFESTKQREKWLQQVNENIPAAIFVLKDSQIIYCNHVFSDLQKRFQSENPFKGKLEDVEEQEVWLNDEFANGYGYWINAYNLGDNVSRAFIVSDITAAKLQGSFIQKIARDLTHQNKNSLDEMLRLISDFLPGSTLFIGSYDSDASSYAYLNHRGADEVSKSHFLVSDTLLKEEAWSWFDLDDLNSAEVPLVVRQSKGESFGVMSFGTHSKDPLGVIFLVLPKGLKTEEISPLFLDFLAIFSLRVKSELEHKHDKRLLRQSSAQYRAIIENSNEAIVDLLIQPNIHLDESVEMQWDRLKNNSKIVEVNPVFLDIFESHSLPSNRSFFAIKSIKHLLHYVLESGFSNEIIEVAHQKNNGEVIWLSCNALADIKDRRVRQMWLVIQDITDRKNHIQHLEYQARHDKLTGLANRSALHDYLEEKIDQADQFGLKVALFLIDLNRFKEINEALGHHYGDVLLKKIEPRVRTIISDKRGFLARLGGDEFAVVIPAIQDEKEANQIAQNIAEKIREPFDLGSLNVEIGSSIGISYYPDNGQETSTLLRCADVAMYQAKKQTASILSYRNEMDENSPRRLALMVDMKKGLRNQEFHLVYQPKLDLEKDKIYCAEALIRWEHPELGHVSPAEFIPLAEMSDVIISMTHWVIDEALQQIKSWQTQGVDIKVSVNVSTKNLLDDDLPEYIYRKIEQYQVSAHLLEVEITESALMADPERALSTLRKINEMGVSISVDDFGTGYSSFIYLRELPIDTLKIDIMFVRNMCRNKQDEIIVNSLIHLAHNLSLSVVAEGAEHLDTMERLKLMGCNYVQGYFVSKPVTPDEFLITCNNWHK